MLVETFGNIFLNEQCLDKSGKVGGLLVRSRSAAWYASEAIVWTAAWMGKYSRDVKEKEGACEQAAETWYEHDGRRSDCEYVRM